MRKQRYKERRPIRLGAMQVIPTRHETPSFFRALVAAGLTDAKTPIENAWGIWDGVCRDSEVIRLSMALEKSKKVFLPSVSAPFVVGTQVLAAMSDKQIEALKIRLGVHKD